MSRDTNASWSIKTYLVLLAASAGIPLLLLLGYSFYISVRTNMSEAGNRVLNLAEVTAASTDEYLSETSSIALLLSQRAEIQALEPKQCAASLAGLPPTRFADAALTVVDLRGAIVCTSRSTSANATATMRGTDWFQHLIREKRPVYSRPLIDPMSGTWVSVNAWPILDASARLIGAVAVNIDLKSLSQNILKATLPPNSTITVVDSAGLLLSRFPWRATVVGRSARGIEITERVLVEHRGIAETLGVDRVKRVYGFVPLDSLPWFVAVGIPSDLVYAPARGMLTRIVWLAGLVLVVTGLGAWWLGRRITQPCDAFLASVRALGRGDYTRLMPPTGPAELATVASAFNDMARARMDAERAMTESRESFRSLAEHAAVGIFRADERAWFSYVNPCLCEILGRSPEQILGEGWVSALHPDDRERVLKARERTVAAGRGRENEFRFVRPDGTIVWVDGAANQVRGSDGASMGLVGTITDITERYLHERRIRQWETIFRHAGWGIVVADVKSNGIVAANPAAARMYQYSIESLQGKQLDELFAPESRADLRRYAAIVADQGHCRYESMHARADGTRFPVAVDVASFVDDAAVSYRVANVQDITERVRVSAALRTSEERYRLALRASNEAIVDRNYVTGAVYFSDRYAEILGYAPGEITLDNDTWISFMHADDRPVVLEHLRRHVEQNEAYDITYRLRAKDGGYRWMRARAQAQRDETGRALRSVAAVEDITEQVRARDELRAARDRAKTLADQLLRAQEAERRQIARELHDQIGQELTAIKLTVSALDQAGARLPARIAEVKKLVDETIARARDLSLTLRPPQLDYFGLVAALTWHLDSYVRPSGLEVIFDRVSSFPRLPAEIETACFRIAQESLTNVMRHARATQVRMTLAYLDGAVRMAIADNGIGFDVSSVRDRAARGQSIGVLGMEERASLVGGRLKISSVAGQGCEVVATIPLDAYAGSARSPGASTDAALLPGP